MSGGPHLRRVEARVTEHVSEAPGVIPPGPEAQHAEEVTDPLTRRRAEVDGNNAPTRLEDPADLRQPSPLHVVGQMVEHQTAQHRSEEHTSELQSPVHLVCRLLLEKKKKKTKNNIKANITLK